MKYNAKYDRWVTKGGLVYRYSKRQDKLVMCKLNSSRLFASRGFKTKSSKGVCSQTCLRNFQWRNT